MATGAAPFDSFQIADIGDVAVNPFSLLKSIDIIEAYYRECLMHDVIPVSVGGDHTITLPILRAITSKHDIGIIAVLLIAGSTLLLGLLSSVKPVRLAGSWIESKILNPVPMYRMLKTLVAAMLNMEDESGFKPALLISSDGIKEPIYVVEDRGTSPVLVMQPWSPTPFTGSVKVVNRRRIEPLPVTLDEFSLALTHFGLGISEVLEKNAEKEVEGG